MSATETFVERARIDHDCENCAGRSARLAMQLDRFRDRTRISRGVTAHISEGEVTVGTISGVGDRVQPGFHTAEFDFRANLDLIQIGEQDGCDCGIGATGVRTRFVATIDGREIDSFTDCLCFAASGSREVGFTVDEPGRHVLEVRAEGAVTGDVADRSRKTFSVEEPTRDEETDDSPPPGFQDPDDESPLEANLLPCFLDPTRSCERIEALGWGAAAALVVAVALR